MQEWLTMGLLISLPHLYLNRRLEIPGKLGILVFCLILWPIPLTHALLLGLGWTKE